MDPGTGKVLDDTDFLPSCLLFIDDNCETQRAAGAGAGGGGGSGRYVLCIDKTVWDNIRVSWYDIDL